MLHQPTCRRIYKFHYRSVRFHGTRRDKLVFRMRYQANLVNIHIHLISCIHLGHYNLLSKFWMHSLLLSTFDLEMLVSSQQSIRSAQLLRDRSHFRRGDGNSQALHSRLGIYRHLSHMYHGSNIRLDRRHADNVRQSTTVCSNKPLQHKPHGCCSCFGILSRYNRPLRTHENNEQTHLLRSLRAQRTGFHSRHRYILRDNCTFLLRHILHGYGSSLGKLRAHSHGQ